MSSTKNYIYIILAGALAGLIGIFVKLISSDVHFMTLAFYRMFLALILLIIIVPFIDKKWYKVKKNDLFHYFIVSFLMVVTFSLFILANLFASIQNVVLITNVAPFLVLIWASFVLSEKITKTKIITLIIAIVGVVILNPFKFGENQFGNIVALIQAFTYSWLIIWMRKEGRDHKIGSVIWYFLFASLLLLPMPFIFGFGNLSGNTLWLVFGLGVFSTGFAYLFHNLGLEKIGAEMSSIIIMVVMPLTGILTAFFVLNESLDLRVIVGGIILIIAGIYLEMHEKGLRKAVKKIFAW